MSLEELIERLKELKRLRGMRLLVSQPVGDVLSDIVMTEGEIITFVLEHADALIAWERQTYVRTSPFDEG